jgi:hypothetical protein
MRTRRGAYGGYPAGVGPGGGGYGGYPPGVGTGGAYGAVPGNVRVAPTPGYTYTPPYAGLETCAPNAGGVVGLGRKGLRVSPLGVLGMLADFNERCR